MCFASCCLSLSLRAKVISHWSQLKGRKFVWRVSKCRFKWNDVLNVMPHWSQVLCFTNSCKAACFERSFFVLNELLHSSQTNSFNSFVLWVAKWLCKEFRDGNSLLHVGQLSFLTCICWWTNDENEFESSSSSISWSLSPYKLSKSFRSLLSVATKFFYYIIS